MESRLFAKWVCLAWCGLAFNALSGKEKSLEGLDATLWIQTSAEYRAVTTEIYRSASHLLPLALEDPAWSAVTEEGTDFEGLPPAVVLDVDETVLDNTAFQARLLRSGKQYNPAMWKAWCEETNAVPVPGALAFTQFAARNGVAVFYLTNRGKEVEGVTRKNLEKFGFPLDSEVDTVLTKGERTEWNSDKTSRRAFIASRYRVLFLFGDDFNDFVHALISPSSKRVELEESLASNWGRKWFLLPNPTYGSWERSLYDFKSGLSSKERTKLKIEGLRTDE